jgi:tetratricopeptide (TPR) repeat protein
MARDLGRLEEAERAYREGLELQRKILAGSGETPAALRDASVSLNRVGDVARDLGRLEEAKRAYQESAHLSRALRERLGDSRQVLDDLTNALDRLGSTLAALGRNAEALEHLREAEALLARLSLVYPEHPEYETRLQAIKSLIERVSG